MSEKPKIQKISYSSKFVRVGNKPMLEKTPIVRTFNPVTHQWTKKVDKENAELVDLKNLGWTKEIVSKIAVKRTIPDIESMTGTRELWYIQEIKYVVNPRYPWVFLKRENGKVWIKDFMTSVCFPTPKKSSDYVDVYKNDGKRVEKDVIKKLTEQKELDGIYAKTMETEDGTVYVNQVYTRDQKGPSRS